MEWLEVCSVLQCVAVCCSVAVYCSMSQCVVLQYVVVCCSVLQYVAVCYVAVCAVKNGSTAAV